MDVMRTTFQILSPGYPDGIEMVDAGAYIGDLTIPLAQLGEESLRFRATTGSTRDS